VKDKGRNGSQFIIVIWTLPDLLALFLHAVFSSFVAA
jgi:hypothetical protein